MYTLYEFIGKRMKFNSSTSAVIFGYESLDDTISNNQFNFTENDSKNNYFEGNKMEFCQYLVKHFCSPGDTTLDLSDDPEGLHYRLITMQLCILLCTHIKFTSYYIDHTNTRGVTSHIHSYIIIIIGYRKLSL